MPISDADAHEREENDRVYRARVVELEKVTAIREQTREFRKLRESIERLLDRLPAALPAVDAATEKPWDGHDLNHLASILFDHALVEIQCDHDEKTDRPICACSLIELGWHPSVGAARQAWVDHVMAVVRGKWTADAILRRASAIGYEGLLPAVDAPPETTT